MLSNLFFGLACLLFEVRSCLPMEKVVARLPSGLPSLLKYWSPSFQSVIHLGSMRLHFLRLMQKQHCTGLHNIYHMISHGMGIFCIICLHCLFQLIRKPVQVRLPRINSHNDLTYESLVPSTERDAVQGCACWCGSLN